jgi:hypothetical protein
LPAAVLAVALTVGRLAAFALVVVVVVVAFVAFVAFAAFAVVVMASAVLVSLGPAPYPPVLALTLEMPCQSKGRNSVRPP